MSEIVLDDIRYPSGIEITAGRIYDLWESIAASKYPMRVYPAWDDDEITPTVVKLARSTPGEGHDNFLQGIRVAFDIRMTAKMLVEAERYHFFDIVSCNSTMHRITKFDMNDCYNKLVDQRMVAVMTELICQYNEDPSPENYLKVLYSNPAGFTYTMRITTNYRQLKTIYKQRKTHRLPEWRDFCDWITKLPYSYMICEDVAIRESDVKGKLKEGK